MGKQGEDEVLALVGCADEAKVREFLAEVLRGDEKLFVRFQAFIGWDTSKAGIQRYKNQVDATAQTYLGKEHFIPYGRAAGFISEMEEYLSVDVRTMLQDGNYAQAFELTCHIFLVAADVEIDDSDGGVGMLAGQCKEIWTEILNHADAPLQQAAYAWFTGHLDGSVVDYMEEEIEAVLMEEFQGSAYMEKKLAYTEQKVQEEKKRPDSWGAVYHAQKWAMYHIRLMEGQGDSAESILAYCKSHWEYGNVRKYYIEACMERENYDAAIDALEESMQIDAKSPGLVRDFRVLLKEAYRKGGRQEAYKKQLWKLATQDNPGNVEDFRELKGLYAKEEWENVREEIFAALPPHAPVERLYQEEGLYDRLLEYVLKAKGLYAVKQYQSVLKKDYPQQLLQKYTDELQEMAKSVANRRHYKEWAALLRKMLEIEGGKEQVDAIVKQWKILYKNRPAMLEELKQL